MARRTFLSDPDPTEARYDPFGIKETQGGYDWSERMLDPEYVAALRGAYDDDEPPDDDDRDREPPEVTLECHACHTRWTDDAGREDAPCPHCEDAGPHLVIDGYAESEEE